MANYRSGYLEQGSQMGKTNKTVALSADNQVVDPGGASMVILTSDSTTASSRTFTVLPTKLVGAELTLFFNSGSSMTAQLVNTGTMKLESDWTPLQYNQLQLLSDGTNWIEVARGASSGLDTISLVSGNILVGSAGGVAASVTMSGDATIIASGALTIGSLAVSAAKLAADAVTTTKILNSNVTLAKLAAGITPSHVTKFAASVTTVGGNATEAFTVTGVASTDILHVTMRTQGAGVRTILAAAPTTNTITVVFSGDPGNDHVIDYIVQRAAS